MSARAPIFCLEGPSAAGKSTVARSLAEHHGYLVVPEVNDLLRHEKREGFDWYLHRQLDSYTQSITVARSGQAVVLDGDPFQPLWYNWIYPQYEPLALVRAFYQKAVDKNLIAFPDFYAVLEVPLERLVTQKEGDVTRQRRNFDRHLQMISPQRRYFERLRASGGVKVAFIENDYAKDVARGIAEQPYAASAPGGDAHLFSLISEWLEHDRPFPG